MSRFITILLLLVLLAVGAVVGLYFFQRDRLPLERLPEPLREAVDPPPVESPARQPQSYHILQDQGGIPRGEAERGGLISDDFAYLVGLEPIQRSEAIEAVQNITVRGKQYDMCWRFNTEPGETQVLEFNLGGRYAELHLGYAFEDTHPSDTTGKLAVELTVQADGREVLGPERLTPSNPPWFGFVPINGAQRVAIVIKRIGYNNRFAPVLLDPFVRTTLDEPRPET